MSDWPYVPSRTGTIVSSWTDSNAWRMLTRAYNRVRYLAHVDRVFPMPSRKLRKCVMRGLYRRRQEARKRFGL